MMERSRTQTLFNHLPGAVYGHPDGLIVETVNVSGQEMRTANKQALLDEVDRYVRQWPDNRRNVPPPSLHSPDDYRIEVPAVAHWALWPLLFECANPRCGRTAVFSEDQSGRDQLAANPRCRNCGSRLRQLRYYSAHACGRKRPLLPQRCPTHEFEHLYFDDTRSFITSRWRCRACGGAPTRNTNFTPCRCGQTFDVSNTSVMRAYTVNDTRSYHTHTVSLIDIEDPRFDEFRSHPDRSKVVVARLRGSVASLEDAMRDLDEDARGTATRMSAADWEQREEQLRALGLPDSDIADLKKLQGPRDTGFDEADLLPPDVLEITEDRMLAERTALLDPHLVPRITVTDAAEAARTRGQHTVADAIDAACVRLDELGIFELSITWEFPVTLAAVGYTRQVSGVGQGQLVEFRPWRMDRSDTRTQLYALSAKTEAALVQLDPTRVLRWLVDGDVLDSDHPAIAGDVDDPADAAISVLSLFGDTTGHAPAAARATTLVHTMAHTMLTALDDGQVGLAESTLAEWIVPETLSFAVYVNSWKQQTLGAMWTLLNSRTRQWADRSVEAARTCDNDPLCHQQHDRAACERCLYVTFGCRKFNDDLDRHVLADFWTTV